MDAKHVEHAKIRKKRGLFCCKAKAINLEFMPVWMNLDSHLPLNRASRIEKASITLFAERSSH